MRKRVKISRLCVFCGMTTDGTICPRCTAILPRNSQACPRCANPMPDASTAACGSCQITPPFFARAFSPLLYQFPVDTAIKAFKFNRHLFYSPAFAEILAEKRPGDIDAIVPVPLHRWRQAMRGFNQAYELGARLARLWSLPMARNVLRKKKTALQSELHADERAANMRGAFAVRGRLKCRLPLIIDDVMTTGETCNELARVLLAAGAEEVCVMTLARARRPD